MTDAFRFLYRVAQKERMSLGPDAHQIYLPAISYFGVTSNQKSTFGKPRTVDDLKVSIRDEIAIVPQEVVINVMQNFVERLRNVCTARRTPSFRYNFP